MMTYKRTAELIIFTFCVLLLGGCGKKAYEEVDYGTFKNSIYQNEYFGFSLPVPSEWSVQDQNAQQRLMQKGIKLVAGDDKNMQAAMKSAEPQTVNLLALFQHPIGAPVPFNPNVICLAERVRDMPGIKRGSDYLYHAQKLMKSGQVSFEFKEKITAEKLDGVDFDVMHGSITLGSKTVMQKYCVTIMKGYALVFIVSCDSEEDEVLLQKILEKVSFKK